MKEWLMEILIDKEGCSGIGRCGLCISYCPDVFGKNGQISAPPEIKKNKLDVDTLWNCNRAMLLCPKRAISVSQKD